MQGWYDERRSGAGLKKMATKGLPDRVRLNYTCPLFLHHLLPAFSKGSPVRRTYL